MNIKFNNLKNHKNPKGFTLIELIMSSAILLVLITVLTSIFGSVIDAGVDSKSSSAIDQDGRYVIARLIYDTQRASDIVAPVAPGSQTYSSLTIRIDSQDFIYSLNGDENLQVTDPAGTNVLNSYTTKIQNLTFQRIGIGNSSDTIQMKFDLVSRIKEASGYETRSFQTTFGLR